MQGAEALINPPLRKKVVLSPSPVIPYRLKFSLGTCLLAVADFASVLSTGFNLGVCRLPVFHKWSLNTHTQTHQRVL